MNMLLTSVNSQNFLHIRNLEKCNLASFHCSVTSWGNISFCQRAITFVSLVKNIFPQHQEAFMCVSGLRILCQSLNVTQF